MVPMLTIKLDPSSPRLGCDTASECSADGCWEGSFLSVLLSVIGPATPLSGCRRAEQANEAR